MSTFNLTITVDDELLEVQQAELVSSTLQSLAQDVGHWRAVPVSRKLRDRDGRTIGQAWLDDGLDY